ncbi:hypothetical protein QBC41DRAFT_53967 [Cercophora samala]|uniref:Uncharacterized protein n=1 Tax=Cercophora samala TaxID=330535 RepID=A0AA39ZNB9_9PEZI|nr:hypothetical protein QBC41DRAFT_53967 [Cercophora samala]
MPEVWTVRVPEVGGGQSVISCCYCGMGGGTETDMLENTRNCTVVRFDPTQFSRHPATRLFFTTCIIVLRRPALYRGLLQPASPRNKSKGKNSSCWPWTAWFNETSQALPLPLLRPGTCLCLYLWSLRSSAYSHAHVTQPMYKTTYIPASRMVPVDGMAPLTDPAYGVYTNNIGTLYAKDDSRELLMGVLLGPSFDLINVDMILDHPVIRGPPPLGAPSVGQPDNPNS